MGGCAPQTTVDPTAAKCGQQCLKAAGDSDCDGLPDKGRDPWKTQCNRLLINDDLAVSPGTPGSLWGVTNKHSWACGMMELHPDARLDLAQTSKIPVNILVEVKFALGKITNAANWDVRITTGHGSGASGYACRVAVDKNLKTPGLHLVWGGCSGSLGIVSGFVDTPGTVYYLQSHFEGSKQTCRLIDAAGKVLAVRVISYCPKPKAGSGVRVSTHNRYATVHHVRIFQGK